MSRWRSLPDPVVPRWVSALINVTAANISLEVLIASLAGTAEGSQAVLTGRVSTAVGQSVQGESEL